MPTVVTLGQLNRRQRSGEAVIIDPSVTVVEKGGAPVHIDAMITSHGHEPSRHRSVHRRTGARA